jgi:hypothetical protein
LEFSPAFGFWSIDVAIDFDPVMRNWFNRFRNSGLGLARKVANPPLGNGMETKVGGTGACFAWFTAGYYPGFLTFPYPIRAVAVFQRSAAPQNISSPTDWAGS